MSAMVDERPQLDEPADGQCRLCGCTDERACPGGCWWVRDDLCSSCWDLETPYSAAESDG